eukprot:TRINITY_DN8466_c0_g1_i1.p1 TRINITY_DN8466_c0_g1~~TRINITY_DN8466_c0_g1_i1.p1  ORF type:complete len:265 (-),score=51.85 TRINITY_DN8466_c0_g1_i1:19-813(-)
MRFPPQQTGTRARHLVLRTLALAALVLVSVLAYLSGQTSQDPKRERLEAQLRMTGDQLNVVRERLRFCSDDRDSLRSSERQKLDQQSLQRQQLEAYERDYAAMTRDNTLLQETNTLCRKDRNSLLEDVSELRIKLENCDFIAEDALVEELQNATAQWDVTTALTDLLFKAEHVNKDTLIRRQSEELGFKVAHIRNLVRELAGLRAENALLAKRVLELSPVPPGQNTTLVAAPVAIVQQTPPKAGETNRPVALAPVVGKGETTGP